MMQGSLLAALDSPLAELAAVHRPATKPVGQLLKWVGNKQRVARGIVGFFPTRFGTYFEPFLGSGAVLATLQPRRALASDAFGPLIGIWRMLQSDPDVLVGWYAERLGLCHTLGKREAYARILANYNAAPNPADFIFLSRSCYGGVIRFRKDGHMSTPCGVHEPISADAFETRVATWRQRVASARFACLDYREAMAHARAGDLVYCDPPYHDTQSILYGAQAFRLAELFDAIADCKARGVTVVLSHDGSKKSGSVACGVALPEGLFAREVTVDVGRSMLRRFQRGGETLEDDVVQDRLLLTH